MREDYPRYPRDVRERQIVSRPARERRLAELHLTGYPSVLNDAAFATVAAEPLPARKGKKAPVPESQVVMEARAVPPMTNNQFVARIVAMAEEERRRNEERRKKGEAREPLSAPESKARLQHTVFDRSSTYRLDYCNKDVPGFHERVRTIPDYRKNWDDVDKANIEEALKFPYLTMPDSLLKKMPTVYRHDYMPQAGKGDLRTLPYNTNLQDLHSSFAYSAYGVDNPARVIQYDKTVAACQNPRCLLWKTYSPRDSLACKEEPQSVANELRRLRELRHLQSSKTSSRSSEASSVERRGMTRKTVVIPGMKGMGYRQAPKEGKDYIYLPRDHFCHQVVYDY